MPILMSSQASARHTNRNVLQNLTATMQTRTGPEKFCVPLETSDYLHLPFSVLKTTSSIFSLSFKKIAFL